VAGYRKEATMRHSFRFWFVIASLLASPCGLAQASAKAKSTKPVAAADTGPKKEVNACGCYKDGAGACFCGKKGACACPGECEPKGCEEKRNKEIEKEVAAETKKAAEADKKQRAASQDESPPRAPKHKSDKSDNAGP
jgi:hypothetical protein